MMLVVPGYDRLSVDGVRGVSLPEAAQLLTEIIRSTTVYDHARTTPDARRLEGRAPVFAIELEGVGFVVVKRSMRGGWAAKITADRFLPPTRGLRELVNSVRLRAAGVRAPELVAFVTYPAGRLLRRCDVITREIPDAYDLAEVFTTKLEERDTREVLEAVATLVVDLTRAGAHHPDLNLKNILVSRSPETRVLLAHLIDVDRVRFNLSGSPLVTAANMDRLLRSLRKWMGADRITLTEPDLAWLQARVREIEA